MLHKLDPDILVEVLNTWLQEVTGQEVEPVQVWAVDGKALRKSRRRGRGREWRVLHVLEQAAGKLKALGWVKELQGEESRRVELLWTLPPLEDALLTLDAGNMNRRVATAVVAKKEKM